MASQAPDILTLHASAQPGKVALVDDRPGAGVGVELRGAQCPGEPPRERHARGGHRAPRSRDLVRHELPDVVAMSHAARKIGATAVPLNYRLAPEEAAYVVDNSDAVLVWADVEQRELFERIRPHVPRVRKVVLYGDGDVGRPSPPRRGSRGLPSRSRSARSPTPRP